ncbi:MAG TPA: hypothetical protein VK169_14935 [Saprospiraceae bacterium]|nr:hypothetical protein [Saprospiraceae bacterium]
MKELTLLTPAETLLILSPATSKLEEFARITFYNLLLRKILIIECKKTRGETYYEINKIQQFVSLGPNFNSYNLEKHESIFLIPFNNDLELKLSLRNLVKIVFEGIKSTDEFKMKYLYNHRISIYFSSNLFQRLLGIKKINSLGLELQKKISHFLNHLEKELDLSKNKKANLDLLAERLMSINGNIFLFKNINGQDFEVLKKYDDNKRETHHMNTYNDYGLFYLHTNQYSDSNFNFISETTNIFHDCINSSSPSDFIGSDSTDISGDSGCSGCGGCS